MLQAVKSPVRCTPSLKPMSVTAPEPTLEERIKEIRGYIRKIAKKFVRPGLERDDLEQEAVLGIMKMYDKFDPTKGFKFITYAASYIKDAVRKAANQNGVIKIPLGWLNLTHKYERVKDQLMSAGKPSGPDDVVKEMGYEGDKAVKVRKRILKTQNLMHMVSENAGSSENEENTLEKVDPAWSAQTELIAQELTRSGGFLNLLPERTRQILRLYKGGNGKTQTDIAKILGLTPARISQLINEAYNTIREKLYA